VNPVELSLYTSDEEKAADFLRQKGVLMMFDVCPFCGSTMLGRVRRGKFKCYGCRKEWGQRKASILDGLKIPFTKFIMVVKLFELDTSVREASRQLGLAYNTVYSVFNIIRSSIVSIDADLSFLSFTHMANEPDFRLKNGEKAGKGATGKMLVFGILERGGKVRVELLKDIQVEKLLEMKIKKIKRGSLIYTDKFRNYSSLVMYGFYRKITDSDKRFSNSKVYIDDIEGFWSYAKEKLMKYHGFEPNRFPLYLKEMEFRYNNRQNDLYDKILQSLIKYHRVAYTD